MVISGILTLILMAKMCRVLAISNFVIYTMSATAIKTMGYGIYAEFYSLHSACRQKPDGTPVTHLEIKKSPSLT